MIQISGRDAGRPQDYWVPLSIGSRTYTLTSFGLNQDINGVYRDSVDKEL